MGGKSQLRVTQNETQVISIKNYAHDLRVIIQLMQYHNKVSGDQYLIVRNCEKNVLF